MDGERGLSKLDDGIPFGHTFTYLWNITANFAPSKDDDKCVPWGYHSHVASMEDIETGLVGLLVICNPGNKACRWYQWRVNIVQGSTNSVICNTIGANGTHITDQ